MFTEQSHLLFQVSQGHLIDTVPFFFIHEVINQMLVMYELF